MTNDLSVDQYGVLTRPLNPTRVKKLQKNSYLEAWDVRAHLIRIFGYGGFSVTADEAEMISAREVPQAVKKGETPPNPPKMNWEVCWKVRVTLVIPALQAVYTEYAIGSSSQPSLPESHDMAIKSAESDALKRAAVNLGTQFGLSLYSNGSLQDVVRGTLVRPLGSESPEVTPDQVRVALSPGSDAPDAPEPAEAVEEPDETHIVSPDAESWLAELRALITEADNGKRILGVAALKEQAKGHGILDQTTTVQGNPITLARLADLVAQGQYTPDATDEPTEEPS